MSTSNLKLLFDLELECGRQSQKSEPLKPRHNFDILSQVSLTWRRAGLFNPFFGADKERSDNLSRGMQGGTDRPVGGEENADTFVISVPKVPTCNPKRGFHPNSNSTEGMNISPA